jgi:hypothetical protein
MTTAAPMPKAEAVKETPRKTEFAQAIPEPYQILGLKLLPLSIGRYRRLARHDCAFVAKGMAEAGVGDLLLGVVICSMRCDEFDALVVAPGFAKDLKQWGDRVMPTPRMAKLKWLYPFWDISFLGKRWRENHSVNLLERFELFKRYIAGAQAMPRFYSKATGGKTSAAHWVDNVEMVLRSELNWTSEEVNEQPLSKALADWCNWAHANGHIELFTDEDIAEAKHNDERIRQAFLKQKGAKV